MPDYQQMYFTLFNRISDAIADLQEAQRLTEEMYTREDDVRLFPLPPRDCPKKD